MSKPRKSRKAIIPAPAGPLCQHPIVDAKMRAKLCGASATTAREAEPGVRLTMCAEHAATFDAKRSRAAWEGAIAGIAELTGESPEKVAEMVGAPPDVNPSGKDGAS